MEALAAEWERRANTAEASAEATAHFTDEECAAFRGEQKAWTLAARMLREALAAEALPTTTTALRRVNVPSEWAASQGLAYGCGDIVRGIPLAGPGLWRVVGIGADRPGMMALWVVPA